MRIVAGQHRGRTLFAPRGDKTRPTADRVREALFSILHDVTDLAILDVYAGSGAVGLEALSRGAARVVAVEKARGATESILRNAEGMGYRPPVYTLLTGSAERSLAELARQGQKFGLIFADPPYAEATVLLGHVLRVAPQLLEPQGTIVLEHASRDASPDAPEGFVLVETRRYGEAALAFYTEAA